MLTRILVVAAFAIATSPLPGHAQMAPTPTATGSASAHPTLAGVWTNKPPPETRAYQNWSFSTEPPPMTDWAMERFEQAKPTFGPTSYTVTETNDPVYQCFPPGTPRIYFHPFPMEIIELPDRVMMVFEYDHLIRQIWTDGRGHRDDLSPSWMGDAIGHWDGDTLVVETTNFNDKTWLDRRGVPHSEQLKLTERIHLTDPDHLQIDLVMEDPVALKAPWKGQRFYGRVDWSIEEFMCMDNVSFLPFEKKAIGDAELSPDSTPVVGGEY